MNSVGSSSGMSPDIYAMKKAMEIQGQSVMKVLESAQAPAVSAASSGGSVTGLGQKIDIKA
jgi:hypothetical protein